MRSTDNSQIQGRALGYAAWCLVLGATPAVHAEQWYVEPSASIRALYDDNVRLGSVNNIGSFAATATAEVESGRRSETTELGVRAKLLASRYTEVSDLDETDGMLGFLSARQMGRSRFKFDGEFNYDSTSTSEVSTTGFVQANKRRQRFLLSPSWNYTLTPRSQVEASFSYQGVAYEDVELIPLFDYSFSQVGLTLIHSLSERSQGFSRVTYDKYDASTVDTQSDNYGFELGANYRLSETLTFSAFAGLRHSKAETPGLFGIEETENTGPLFETSLTKTFQVGQLNLKADRSLLPSSSGTLLDTTSLGMSFDYPIGPRWTLSFSAEGYKNRTPDGNSSSSDRDYLSFSPRLRHRLSESLYLDLGYRYRWQKYDTRSDEAESNAIYLGLQYSLPREPLRRWSLLE
ncbi:outer membrane beta-barrel protein [Thiocystis violacea]|uniref:outer membrane beta-barrel protein n=1 Tax=Thiocystis violacea TaxID=13725 RepID=UPI0019039E92|nr:outer membrane beta-barrel protein [Thiocystis violacea]MBK1719924.1 hypothetical protein [Thiocystis violacea]